MIFPYTQACTGLLRMLSICFFTLEDRATLPKRSKKGEANYNSIIEQNCVTDNSPLDCIKILLQNPDGINIFVWRCSCMTYWTKTLIIQQPDRGLTILRSPNRSKWWWTYLAQALGQHEIAGFQAWNWDSITCVCNWLTRKLCVSKSYSWEIITDHGMKLAKINKNEPALENMH